MCTRREQFSPTKRPLTRIQEVTCMLGNDVYHLNVLRGVYQRQFARFVHLCSVTRTKALYVSTTLLCFLSVVQL